jgi:hypothetical protein
VVAAVIAYLVTVLYLAPAPAGQPEPQTTLAREVISASSAAVCQAHADKLADKRRAADAETLRRFGGRIVGECKKAAA